MKAILLGSLLIISCCTCVGPIFALSGAERYGLAWNTFDWGSIGISFTISAVCAFLFLALGKVIADASETIRELKRPIPNSKIRELYYPEYTNRQEAKRMEAAERETHNDNAYAAAFWAGAKDYIDYDGNSRRVKGVMDDYYPQGSFRVGDDQIIAHRVTRGQTKPRHTPVKIVKR